MIVVAHVVVVNCVVYCVGVNKQMVIKNILAPAGYTVTMCSDGIECLDLLEKRDVLPDLLLLDIMMPQMSGYEVCFRLREMFPTSALPIIMVSAKTRESCIVDGFKAGANDYLTKPYKRQELLARVETQLRLKEVWRTEIEAEKTDDMLQQLLPPEVLSRLKCGELVADVHNNLTVLVADVSHTSVSLSARSPVAAMKYLEQVFEHFKHLCDIHRAYKVETMGATMMAVTGHEPADLAATGDGDSSPERQPSSSRNLNDSDPHRIYALAMDLLDYLDERNAALSIPASQVTVWVECGCVIRL